jgi:hypothetical protein
MTRQLVATEILRRPAKCSKTSRSDRLGLIITIEAETDELGSEKDRQDSIERHERPLPFCYS